MSRWRKDRSRSCNRHNYPPAGDERQSRDIVGISHDPSFLKLGCGQAGMPPDARPSAESKCEPLLL